MSDRQFKIAMGLMVGGLILSILGLILSVVG